jgi:hypothetical protein
MEYLSVKPTILNPNGTWASGFNPSPDFHINPFNHPLFTSPRFSNVEKSTILNFVSQLYCLLRTAREGHRFPDQIITIGDQEYARCRVFDFEMIWTTGILPFSTANLSTCSGLHE